MQGYSTLNIMNTTLATQISSLQTSTSTVVQQSIDNTNKQQATTTISSPQNCHVFRSCRAVSDTPLVTTKPQSIQQQQSIKGSDNLSELCPHCTQYVQDGIACDKCDAWFHYKCVGLTEETGRARMANTDYICNFCQDDLLYMDKSSVEFQETSEQHTNELGPYESTVEETSLKTVIHNTNDQLTQNSNSTDHSTPITMIHETEIKSTGSQSAIIVHN